MAIPFGMHHGVIGGTLPRTTNVSRRSTTAVVSPKKPKAKSRSGAITTNGTSIDRHVVVKLETALTSTDGEPVKSGQKRKTEENTVQPTEKILENVS